MTRAPGRTFDALCAAVLCVVLAGAAARSAGAPPVGNAVVAPSAVTGAAVQPDEDPLPVAQGHLRRARGHRDASCQLLRDGDRHAVDGYYAACEEAWNAVWTCPGSADVLAAAAEVYADGLAGLLEAARRHGRLGPEGLWLGTSSRPILVPIEPRALPIVAADIGSIEPQAQPDDDRISRRHLRAGFGLPVVVRLAPGPAESVAADYAAPRQSLAATAVLRFRLPGGETFLQKFAGPTARDHAPAVLDLANPQEIAAVQIGPVRPPLAADLTAPLLDALAGMPRTGIEGFLQPFGPGDTQPHLEMLEPRQPGRIPVVFIHGLASDDGTWYDMINELRAWPVFQRRFEPWVFHYPTGASFLQSAVALRRQLSDVVTRLDPAAADPSLRNVVLVGHSMGGLHAKLQVVDPGTALWDAVSTRPYAEMRMRPDIKERLSENFFFSPRPYVKRVVCIATPHRGSSLAVRGVGKLASLTVRRPPEMTAVYAAIQRQNPGAFRADYARRLPTTIDILRPDSSILQALERLRPACWVTVHSVVGDGHVSVLGGRDDGVVPVESAHTAGAVSEITVPASHTRVHHHPRTIEEMRRILLQHLHETGLDRAGGQ
ncbi:MAG: esterase/lipase family protein [Planctomycetia bacterium]|jgi:pimeloyl-ACP methyl ester carboxylesterase